MQKQEKFEIWVELLNVEPIPVELEQVYLDPNNPRLAPSGREKVPDKRITESGVQDECLRQMKKEGMMELAESIRTSGFWTIDRIVLRKTNKDKYVVIEGNRRVAALKTLKSAHERADLTLDAEVYRGIWKFEALLYKGNNPNIAWIVQGFRHTPGIKSWERYPKAKFFAEFEKESKKTPSEIRKLFAIKPREDVGDLIRSYYAFEQAREDKDYGDLIGPDKFGYFDEIAMARDELRVWLGWLEKEGKFTNTENLRKYLSWITADEEDKRKIKIAPYTRDTLSKLVLPENKELFEQFENGKLSIEDCKEKLLEAERRRRPIDILDIINDLKEIKQTMIRLPVAELQLAETKKEKEQKAQVLRLLKDLFKVVSRQIKNLE
jgi:hypothetical protein